MELFQALSVPEATVVASLLEIQQIAAGEILIHQGEWARGLCIIEAGQADVQVRYGTGARHTVASCGPGDYFGEMALVIGAECTAAVVARTPLTVLELSRETYDRYLSGIPEVQQHVSRTASRRATTLRHLATAEKYAKTDMVVES
jgi:CRP-like cAMP-binding protein